MDDQRFLKARQAYIAGRFAKLNTMQRRAVLTTEGPLLILAGAGSGKTTALISRIENIVRFGCGYTSDLIPAFVTDGDLDFLENLPDVLTQEEERRADGLCAVEPAAPWSILAITFTNKAANEIKSRLKKVILRQDADSIWAMTFHSACCRILRRDIELLGFGKSFTIYDADDSERVMKTIIRNMGLDDKTFPAKYVLSVVSRAKDKMQSPEDLMSVAEISADERLSFVAKIYEKYQKQLKENNALDFDDIIFYTVRLLQKFPDVRRYYHQKFRYILVDEYQDTSHVQYLLTSLLTNERQNICVVGDDDQSIYRFRGATIENILDFEDQYNNVTTIRLEQNYRSTQSILNVANAVISNNIGRKGKRLWTSNGDGKAITVYEAANEGDEGAYVASRILHDTDAHRGIGFRNHAVLYRTNAQSNAIEYAFKANGIPYRMIGGHRFFDRAEVKDMLSYLCVIHNPNDDLRLRRIVNNPPRGLGETTLTTATRLAEAEGIGLFSVMDAAEEYAPLQKAAGKLKAFTSVIRELSELLDTGICLPDFYDAVMAKTGYAAMLEEKQTDESMARLENIRELRSSINAYLQNAEVPTLAGFLEEISLYTDIERYDEDDDVAVMMTMHSAKGLEFPNVYLVGFEEGLFPGMRAIGDATEMEEERRLCYVAITRAKEKLTISYARQRMLYGRTSASAPSRFLSEIPKDMYVKKGGMQSTYYAPAYPVYRPAAKPSPMRKSYDPAPKADFPEVRKGDMVEHKIFGRGMVLTVVKAGGDALLEIAFDGIGTKKLMARTAFAHMKKL